MHFFTSSLLEYFLSHTCIDKASLLNHPSFPELTVWSKCLGPHPLKTAYAEILLPRDDGIRRWGGWKVSQT